MPASWQASKELSTISFITISKAFAGLSNPSKCLFFSKNSATEISRCSLAISSAVFILSVTFITKSIIDIINP